MVRPIPYLVYLLPRIAESGRIESFSEFKKNKEAISLDVEMR